MGDGHSERSDGASDLHALLERLYPIHRSMTGDGLRETLAVLDDVIPIDITEVQSGTRVGDWTVPPEWKIREAWIEGPGGDRVVDLADSNLHVVANSSAIDASMPLSELEPHLHSIESMPEAIPYRTAYFSDDWGFCLADRTRRRLEDGEYRVYIDADHDETGSLTLGESVIDGRTADEIVLYSHTCHPSLANDNLSGIVVATEAMRRLSELPQQRFGVRLVLGPATIGSITWLAMDPRRHQRVHAGLTLVSLGDTGDLCYKRSFSGDRRIDRVAGRTVAEFGGSTIDYYPFGYDERQFNAPGVRLPFGSLMRSRHGSYPEYHTSADDPDFVSSASLAEAVDAVVEIVQRLQTGRILQGSGTIGEPQLGRRGLYESVQGDAFPKDLHYAVLWVLTYADGEHDIDDVVIDSGLDRGVVERAVGLLSGTDLLVEPG